MRRIILSAFLLVSGVAQAAPVTSDTARVHYERGAVLYEATRYEAALHEFEAAQAMQPMPALVFDIAKCLDKLGRTQDALAAYKRYLDEAPASENASEVKTRMEQLSTPAANAPAPPLAVTLKVEPLTAPVRSRKHYLVPSLVGGAGVVLTVIGAGLLGSTSVDYGRLDSSCAPVCERSSWASLPAREHAGEALLGIAAVVAVVDVVFWIREARRK